MAVHVWQWSSREFAVASPVISVPNSWQDEVVPSDGAALKPRRVNSTKIHIWRESVAQHRYDRGPVHAFRLLPYQTLSKLQ